MTIKTGILFRIQREDKFENVDISDMGIEELRIALYDKPDVFVTGLLDTITRFAARKTDREFLLQVIHDILIRMKLDFVPKNDNKEDARGGEPK